MGGLIGVLVVGMGCQHRDRRARPEPSPVMADLFNGQDLSGFYTWLLDSEYADPRDVFTVTNRQLRISGDGMGYLATHQEFSDDVNGFGSLVTGPDGEPLAAVNAYGPDYRFPGDRDAAEVSAAVLETARAIADRLG